MIPEILFDPSLMLSPQVFLLEILFCHCAFSSDDLNDNPHMLSTLKIFAGAKELPLKLKDCL